MRLFLALMLWLAVAPLARGAEVLSVADPGDWFVFGGRISYLRDGGAPGGAGVEALPTDTKDPWSSSASIPFKSAVKAGEAYTAVVWLKAPSAGKVTALLIKNAPPYPAFAQAEIAGTGQWERVVVTGVAKADAALGENGLSLQLGRAGGPVLIGPAMILRGAPDQAELSTLARTYKPSSRVEDVTFVASDGARLAGTLRTPTGKGRFPVVLMLGGSGPNVRGGFARLNASLLAAGIATLEYDKRGCGQSTGERTETLERLSADAEAALALLRARRDIDPARVIVLGSSQGGVVAPAVAIRDGRLVGIVSQVAPALPGPLVASDQVARQLSNQWPQGGSYEAQRRFVDGLVAIVQSSPDAATARARISDAVAASVKAGRIPPDAAESMVEGFSDASMRDVLTYRPVEVLSRLQGPALFVYGGKDIQVSSEQNAPVAREALKHNPQARVVVLEGLNHFLQRPRTADPEEWRALGGMMSDPQAMNLIVAWIESVLAVRRGADTRASATARPAA